MRSKPERKLDKEFFHVTESIVMHSPRKVFDGHAEKLRALRSEVGDDLYFETLDRHWQRNAHHWANAGVDTDALMRNLVHFCSTFGWFETS